MGHSRKVGRRVRGPGRALGAELARRELPGPGAPEAGLSQDGMFQGFVLLLVPELGWHLAGDRHREHPARTLMLPTKVISVPREHHIQTTL